MRKLITMACAVVAAVLFVWFFADVKQGASALVALVVRPERASAAKTKPICSQVIVPAGDDCIPQHLANLPPDPGKEGETKFVDANNDKVRDDIERLIEINYGESRRAVMALRTIAKNRQYQVDTADTVSREQAFEQAQKYVAAAAACYYRTVDKETQTKRAAAMIETAVLNTPERFIAWQKHEQLLANHIYTVAKGSTTELCGYNPDALPN